MRAGSELAARRRGRVARSRLLIKKDGRNGNMTVRKEQLNCDCPKHDAHGLHERCDLVRPDLPKVL